MLPPLMTDRSHRNIFLPELRANMIRNHSLEDEVFDYNPVALRALKPNRIPLCNLQMPFQGSFLSPQPFFQQPPLVLESLTPVPERKFITELRRPNHVKNQHVQIFPSRHQLYFPPTSTNTARMDYSPALVKPALEEYYDAPAYPSALEDHTLEKQRRKIDTLISTGHQRTQSNIMVGSQSTKHLSMALKTDPGYGPGELPKHVTALEKYNIKVRKDVEKKSPTEITKGQNPSETSSGKKVKPRPPEEKSKKEEENSVTITKSKTEEKKQVTHHKSSGDDMRKQAIMNNLNKRAVSDPSMSGGDVVILNHPIFSRKIFINFNKDILKPKVLPQIDSQSSPKSYRIPPRRYILKSRGGKYGYGGGDKNEDPAQYNEYVYKSSRKDKPKFSDYVKTETDLDDDENQIPIRNEQKRITTLIHSIKKPSKSDLFLPASFEKPSDIKMSGLISPRAHLASDRLMMSPKNSLGTDYVFMTSPRNNKTPRY